ncbi:hypothetical protein ACTTAF_05815 [Rhodobacter capsulatus]|uniref:hypothetical protein n=1 Tax=Rhodobacter capsulatus TaxID=1061 RepID=UPI00403892C0
MPRADFSVITVPRSSVSSADFSTPVGSKPWLSCQAAIEARVPRPKAPSTPPV